MARVDKVEGCRGRAIGARLMWDAALCWGGWAGAGAARRSQRGHAGSKGLYSQKGLHWAGNNRPRQP